MIHIQITTKENEILSRFDVNLLFTVSILICINNQKLNNMNKQEIVSYLDEMFESGIENTKKNFSFLVKEVMKKFSDAEENLVLDTVKESIE